MTVSVMVELLSDNQYRATAMVPTPLVAEAPSRTEAVDKIRSLVEERLGSAEFIELDLPLAKAANPWLAMAGTWRDHPDVDEVEEHIRDYRRDIDKVADHL